jgi:hypothetical protein
LLKAVALAAGILAVGTPNVKKLGNAIVQYRDETMHSVAAYEYSHRFHNDGWLMIDVAVRTKERLSFRIEDFRLVTPGGSTIPLATEESFVDHPKQIQRIQQNARVWKRSLKDYFVDTDSASFRFFALPGEGVVTNVISTYTYGPALVTLYFESPDSHWTAGSYQLVIDNGSARAALPIELK